MQHVYMDYAATTPTHPEAVTAKNVLRESVGGVQNSRFFEISTGRE